MKHIGILLAVMTVCFISCTQPPTYSRFVDIDSECWTQMAPVEFSPLEEDSDYVAPQSRVSVFLNIRHDSGRHSIIPLEICQEQSDADSQTDTVLIEIGNSRRIRKNGGYGIEVTQIPLIRNGRIADDYRLSVTPIDTVYGIHSVGLTIIDPSLTIKN